MTTALHIGCLILGYLALVFLLFRFGKTKSAREAALFFLLAPAWIIVLSACDLSIAIRAFAETRICLILRLAVAGFANFMAFYLIRQVHPRPYMKPVLVGAAGAIAIVFSIGTAIALLGGKQAFGGYFFPVFALSPGWAATGFAWFVLARSLKEGRPTLDSGMLAALATLGTACLAVFFAPGSLEKTEWIRNLLYADLGIASVLMIAWSLPLESESRPSEAEEDYGAAGGRRAAAKDVERGKNESVESLSNREMEIADLLIVGKSYREIGETLFIAPSTVKTHVLRIYEKTGVKNKVQLANKLPRRR